MLFCLSDVSGAALSHSFELEAKKKAVFYGAPAAITFRIPTKAALQVWHFFLYASIFLLGVLDMDGVDQ